MKKRLHFITFLQFIGPIFVIVGHGVNGMISSDWFYSFSKTWVYIFHMPLFFLISGYLFSFKGGTKDKEYRKYTFDKFKRLIIPYIVWNLIFIVPKIIMQDYIVDTVELSFSYFLYIFVTPRANILGHTWFLAALFILYLFSPLYDKLLSLKKNKYLIWVIVTISLIALNLFPINTYVLAIQDLSKDTLYFWIGLMLGTIPTENLTIQLKKYRYIILFGVIAIVFSYLRLSVTDLTIVILFACTSILAFLFTLPIVFNIDNKIINYFAKNSFGIYIMHWPTMLLIRYIFYQYIGFSSSLVIFLMIVGGYIIPNLIIYVLRLLFSKFNINKKLQSTVNILLGI